jgi:hypothetical protein
MANRESCHREKLISIYRDKPKLSVYIENMMRCTKMFSLIALTSAFAGGLALVSMSSTATAGTATPDLCVATGVEFGAKLGGCEYSDTNAPLLNLEVCWDGQTARLKAGSTCPGRQLTYHAKYGELLDPTTGVIAAYAPLPNACELVECAPHDINAPETDDGVACCNPNTGDCWAPDANGNCTVGDITWCEEIKNNANGTVTCHES